MRLTVPDVIVMKPIATEKRVDIVENVWTNSNISNFGNMNQSMFSSMSVGYQQIYAKNL